MTQVMIQGVTRGTSLSKTTMSQANSRNRLSFNLVGSNTATFAAEILSASANDTVAGTGARTVTVYGLDGNGNLAETTVNMNGTTPVSLGNWTFIHAARVSAVGTSLVGTNLGEISIRTGGAVILTITDNAMRSADAIYKVPANTELVLQNISWQNTGTAEDTSTRIELHTYHHTLQPFARMEYELMPRMGGNSMPLNMRLRPGTIVELVNYRYGGADQGMQAYLTGRLEKY